MMWSMRPSIRGLLSATAMSETASTMRWSIFQPSSVCAISRPLKRTVTLALCPSSRNRRTCLSLKSKSCRSVLGPIFTSFTEIVVCFLRASLSRRACVYLYLPKSMMRQTGGLASGATSTRSRSCPRAVSSACWVAMIPSCSPSALTTRTSRTRIPSLIRISCALLSGVAPRASPRRGGWRETARAGSRAAHGEVGRAGDDLGREVADDPVEREGASVLAAARAQAHGALLGLAAADDEHVGHLAHLRVADLVAELLVAVVQLGAHPGGSQALVDRPRIAEELLGDRQHAGLHGRQPGREGAGVVLGQNADEALERAQNGAMDHHRALGLAVGVDVLELEPLGLLEVDLDRRVLPAASQRVLDVHVDLGTIERAVAGVQLEGQAIGAQRILQPALRDLPLLVGPQRLRRARGELEERLEDERLITLADPPRPSPDLPPPLVEAAVDVGVVLRELADAEQAGQRARPLVAVQPSHVAEAQRQVAV